MRRNRKNNVKKERTIMIASSAFVLAALTMTGVYMKDRNQEIKDDGYTLDFTAVEDSADDKFGEIAQNNDIAENQLADNSALNQAGDVGNSTLENEAIQQEVTEDDLDYMPMEAGSSLVEIPGLTSEMDGLNEMDGLTEENVDLTLEEANTEEVEEEETEQEATANDIVVEKTLHFAEEEGLLRPVSGDILLNYSMDKSIYFATLDQYKYNPAVVLSAEEGATVTVCADAKVVKIYEDAEIGKAVTLDLGDGYQATYGQLREINVSEGAYVDAGDTLGVVAAPTKYYSVEGSNLYFQLTKDGEPVNPEGMF